MQWWLRVLVLLCCSLPLLNAASVLSYQQAFCECSLHTDNWNFEDEGADPIFDYKVQNVTFTSTCWLSGPLTDSAAGYREFLCPCVHAAALCTLDTNTTTVTDVTFFEELRWEEWLVKTDVDILLYPIRENLSPLTGQVRFAWWTSPGTVVTHDYLINVVMQPIRWGKYYNIEAEFANDTLSTDMDFHPFTYHHVDGPLGTTPPLTNGTATRIVGGETGCPYQRVQIDYNVSIASRFGDYTNSAYRHFYYNNMYYDDYRYYTSMDANATNRGYTVSRTYTKLAGLEGYPCDCQQVPMVGYTYWSREAKVRPLETVQQPFNGGKACEPEPLFDYRWDYVSPRTLSSVCYPSYTESTWAPCNATCGNDSYALLVDGECGRPFQDEYTYRQCTVPSCSLKPYLEQCRTPEGQLTRCRQSVPTEVPLTYQQATCECVRVRDKVAAVCLLDGSRLNSTYGFYQHTCECFLGATRVTATCDVFESKTVVTVSHQEALSQAVTTPLPETRVRDGCEYGQVQVEEYSYTLDNARVKLGVSQNTAAPCPCHYQLTPVSLCEPSCSLTQKGTYLTSVSVVSNGSDCPSEGVVNTTCTVPSCALECLVSATVTEMSSCNATCGVGYQWPIYSVTVPTGYEHLCPSETERSVPNGTLSLCEAGPCPVDCVQVLSKASRAFYLSGDYHSLIPAYEYAVYDTVVYPRHGGKACTEPFRYERTDMTLERMLHGLDIPFDSDKPGIVSPYSGIPSAFQNFEDAVGPWLRACTAAERRYYCAEGYKNELQELWPCYFGRFFSYQSSHEVLEAACDWTTYPRRTRCTAAEARDYCAAHVIPSEYESNGATNTSYCANCWKYGNGTIEVTHSVNFQRLFWSNWSHSAGTPFVPATSTFNVSAYPYARPCNTTELFTEACVAPNEFYSEQRQRDAECYRFFPTADMDQGGRTVHFFVHQRGWLWEEATVAEALDLSDARVGTRYVFDGAACMDDEAVDASAPRTAVSHSIAYRLNAQCSPIDRQTLCPSFRLFPFGTGHCWWLTQQVNDFRGPTRIPYTDLCRTRACSEAEQQSVCGHKSHTCWMKCDANGDACQAVTSLDFSPDAVPAITTVSNCQHDDSDLSEEEYVYNAVSPLTYFCEADSYNLLQYIHAMFPIQEGFATPVTYPQHLGDYGGTASIMGGPSHLSFHQTCRTMVTREYYLYDPVLDNRKCKYRYGIGGEIRRYDLTRMRCKSLSSLSSCVLEAQCWGADRPWIPYFRGLLEETIITLDPVTFSVIDLPEEAGVYLINEYARALCPNSTHYDILDEGFSNRVDRLWGLYSLGWSLDENGCIYPIQKGLDDCNHFTRFDVNTTLSIGVPFDVDVEPFLHTSCDWVDCTIQEMIDHCEGEGQGPYNTRCRKNLHPYNATYSGVVCHYITHRLQPKWWSTKPVRSCTEEEWITQTNTPYRSGCRVQCDDEALSVNCQVQFLWFSWANDIDGFVNATYHFNRFGVAPNAPCDPSEEVSDCICRVDNLSATTTMRRYYCPTLLDTAIDCAGKFCDESVIKKTPDPTCSAYTPGGIYFADGLPPAMYIFLRPSQTNPQSLPRANLTFPGMLNATTNNGTCFTYRVYPSNETYKTNALGNQLAFSIYSHGYTHRIPGTSRYVMVDKGALMPERTAQGLMVHYRACYTEEREKWGCGSEGLCSVWADLAGNSGYLYSCDSNLPRFIPVDLYFPEDVVLYRDYNPQYADSLTYLDSEVKNVAPRQCGFPPAALAQSWNTRNGQYEFCEALYCTRTQGTTFTDLKSCQCKLESCVCPYLSPNATHPCAETTYTALINYPNPQERVSDRAAIENACGPHALTGVVSYTRTPFNVTLTVHNCLCESPDVLATASYRCAGYPTLPCTPEEYRACGNGVAPFPHGCAALVYLGERATRCVKDARAPALHLSPLEVKTLYEDDRCTAACGPGAYSCEYSRTGAYVLYGSCVSDPDAYSLTAPTVTHTTSLTYTYARHAVALVPCTATEQTQWGCGSQCLKQCTTTEGCLLVPSTCAHDRFTFRWAPCNRTTFAAFCGSEAEFEVSGCTVAQYHHPLVATAPDWSQVRCPDTTAWLPEPALVGPTRCTVTQSTSFCGSLFQPAAVGYGHVLSDQTGVNQRNQTYTVSTLLRFQAASRIPELPDPFGCTRYNDQPVAGSCGGQYALRNCSLSEETRWCAQGATVQSCTTAVPPEGEPYLFGTCHTTAFNCSRVAVAQCQPTQVCTQHFEDGRWLRPEGSYLVRRLVTKCDAQRVSSSRTAGFAPQVVPYTGTAPGSECSEAQQRVCGAHTASCVDHQEWGSEQMPDVPALTITLSHNVVCTCTYPYQVLPATFERCSGKYLLKTHPTFNATVQAALTAQLCGHPATCGDYFDWKVTCPASLVDDPTTDWLAVLPQCFLVPDVVNQALFDRIAVARDRGTVAFWQPAPAYDRDKGFPYPPAGYDESPVTLVSQLRTENATAYHVLVDENGVLARTVLPLHALCATEMCGALFPSEFTHPQQDVPLHITGARVRVLTTATGVLSRANTKRGYYTTPVPPSLHNPYCEVECLCAAQYLSEGDVQCNLVENGQVNTVMVYNPTPWCFEQSVTSVTGETTVIECYPQPTADYPLVNRRAYCRELNLVINETEFQAVCPVCLARTAQVLSTELDYFLIPTDPGCLTTYTDMELRPAALKQYFNVLLDRQDKDFYTNNTRCRGLCRYDGTIDRGSLTPNQFCDPTTVSCTCLDTTLSYYDAQGVPCNRDYFVMSLDMNQKEDATMAYLGCLEPRPVVGGTKRCVFLDDAGHYTCYAVDSCQYGYLYSLLGEEGGSVASAASEALPSISAAHDLTCLADDKRRCGAFARSEYIRSRDSLDVEWDLGASLNDTETVLLKEEYDLLCECLPGIQKHPVHHYCHHYQRPCTLLEVVRECGEGDRARNCTMWCEDNEVNCHRLGDCVFFDESLIERPCLLSEAQRFCGIHGTSCRVTVDGDNHLSHVPGSCLCDTNSWLQNDTCLVPEEWVVPWSVATVEQKLSSQDADFDYLPPGVMENGGAFYLVSEPRFEGPNNDTILLDITHKVQHAWIINLYGVDYMSYYTETKNKETRRLVPSCLELCGRGTATCQLRGRLVPKNVLRASVSEWTLTTHEVLTQFPVEDLLLKTQLECVCTHPTQGTHWGLPGQEMQSGSSYNWPHRCDPNYRDLAQAMGECYDAPNGLPCNGVGECTSTTFAERCRPPPETDIKNNWVSPQFLYQNLMNWTLAWRPVKVYPDVCLSQEDEIMLGELPQCTRLPGEDEDRCGLAPVGLFCRKYRQDKTIQEGDDRLYGGTPGWWWTERGLKQRRWAANTSVVMMDVPHGIQMSGGNYPPFDLLDLNRMLRSETFIAARQEVGHLFQPKKLGYSCFNNNPATAWRKPAPGWMAFNGLPQCMYLDEAQTQPRKFILEWKENDKVVNRRSWGPQSSWWPWGDFPLGLAQYNTQTYIVPLEAAWPSNYTSSYNTESTLFYLRDGELLDETLHKYTDPPRIDCQFSLTRYQELINLRHAAWGFQDLNAFTPPSDDWWDTFLPYWQELYNQRKDDGNWVKLYKNDTYFQPSFHQNTCNEAMADFHQGLGKRGRGIRQDPTVPVCGDERYMINNYFNVSDQHELGKIHANPVPCLATAHPYIVWGGCEYMRDYSQNPGCNNPERIVDTMEAPLTRATGAYSNVAYIFEPRHALVRPWPVLNESDYWFQEKRRGTNLGACEVRVQQMIWSAAEQEYDQELGGLDQTVVLNDVYLYWYVPFKVTFNETTKQYVREPSSVNPQDYIDHSEQFAEIPQTLYGLPWCWDTRAYNCNNSATHQTTFPCVPKQCLNILYLQCYQGVHMFENLIPDQPDRGVLWPTEDCRGTCTCGAFFAGRDCTEILPPLTASGQDDIQWKRFRDYMRFVHQQTEGVYGTATFNSRDKCILPPWSIRDTLSELYCVHGDYDFSSYRCHCHENWLEDEFTYRCTTPAETCPNDCSGHGDCVSGVCQCHVGYTNLNCSSTTLEVCQASCDLLGTARVDTVEVDYLAPCQCEVDGVLEPSTSTRLCRTVPWHYQEVSLDWASGRYRDYRGTLSHTVSGRLCQRWDTQYPVPHAYYTHTADHNYCRNQGPHWWRKPWCYINEPYHNSEGVWTTWEECDMSGVTNLTDIVTGPYGVTANVTNCRLSDTRAVDLTQPYGDAVTPIRRSELSRECLCHCGYSTDGYFTGDRCEEPHLYQWAEAVCTANRGTMQFNRTSYQFSCQCSDELPLMKGYLCQQPACPVGPNGLQCSGLGTCTYVPEINDYTCYQPVVFNGIIQQACVAEPTQYDRYAGCACELDRQQYCVSPPLRCNTTDCGDTYTPLCHQSLPGRCRTYMKSVTAEVDVRCVCSLGGEEGHYCEVSACEREANSVSIVLAEPCNGNDAGQCVTTNCSQPGSSDTCVEKSQCVCETNVKATQSLYVGAFCHLNVTAQCGILDESRANDPRLTLCSERGQCVCNATYPPTNTSLTLCSSYTCECEPGYYGEKCEFTYCTSDCGGYGRGQCLHRCIEADNGPCNPSNRYATNCTCIPGEQVALSSAGSYTVCCSTTELQTQMECSCTTALLDRTTGCTTDTCNHAISTVSSDYQRCDCLNGTHFLYDKGCQVASCAVDVDGWECGQPVSGPVARMRTGCLTSTLFYCDYSYHRCHRESAQCQCTGSYQLNSETGLCESTCVLAHTVDIQADGGGCVCAPGYKGETCAEELCQNGGTLKAGYVDRCDCPPAYDTVTAWDCSQIACDLDHVDVVGGIIDGECQCEKGYTLPHCETLYCETAHAATYYYHNASDFACQCLEGWTGDLCAVRVCPSPGAVLTADRRDCVCDVANGWYSETGSGFDCQRIQCENGGDWSNATVRCSCPVGYAGTYCESVLCGDHGVWNETFDRETAPADACQCELGWVTLKPEAPCAYSVCNLTANGTACECGADQFWNETLLVCQWECGDHGQYNATYRLCFCDLGYTGPLCNYTQTYILPIEVELDAAFVGTLLPSAEDNYVPNQPVSPPTVTWTEYDPADLPPSDPEDEFVVEPPPPASVPTEAEVPCSADLAYCGGVPADEEPEVDNREETALTEGTDTRLDEELNLPEANESWYLTLLSSTAFAVAFVGLGLILEGFSAWNYLGLARQVAGKTERIVEMTEKLKRARK